MTSDILTIAAAGAAVAVMLAVGKLALIPSNRLGVSVFQPYRGDPWPIGVQEDSDARFSWTGRPAESPPDEVDAAPAVGAFPPAAGDPPATSIEDLVGRPAVEVERLSVDGVHRPRP